MDNKDHDLQSGDSIQSLWTVYSSILDLIKFSDVKAGAVVAVNAILWGLLGFFASKHNQSISFIDNLLINGPAWVLIAVVLSVISILLALLSVYPRLKVGESPSHIYFAHIAKRVNRHMNQEEKIKVRDAFVKEIALLIATQTNLTEEIANQIWANSLVAWKKYKLISWAIKFLFISVLLVLAAITIKILTN